MSLSEKNTDSSASKGGFEDRSNQRDEMAGTRERLQSENPSAVQSGASLEDIPRQKEAPTLGKKAKRTISWYYSILPYNMALGPLGTYVQLTLLQLYGLNLGTIYVGLVVTAFNAATIPASMIWGFITDRLQTRRLIIYSSFFALGVNLLAFLLANNLYSIGLLYSMFALLSTASATPLNLLIMETEPKPKWASSFALLSMISSLGITIGLLLSLGWTAFLPLHLLAIPLAGLSFLSGILALTLIKEPSFVFEREMVVLHRKSFFERLRSLPMFFPRVPRPSEFRRLFGGLRYELTRYTPVLYLSIFAFYVGSGVFNTSIVPAMYGKSFSESQVFLVTLVVMIVQILSFRFVGPFIESKTLVKSAVAGLVVRSFAYSMLGVSFFVASGIWFIAPVLVFYPLSSGIAYAIYYTAANTMVFNAVEQGNNNGSRGSILGVYSAIVGMATMIGSLISGFASVYFGFHITFIVAGFCLAGSAILTSLLNELGRSQENAPLTTAT